MVSLIREVRFGGVRSMDHFSISLLYRIQEKKRMLHLYFSTCILQFARGVRGSSAITIFYQIIFEGRYDMGIGE